MALQLRTAADGDPAPLLAASIDRMLDLLTVASVTSPPAQVTKTAGARQRR